MEYYVFSSDDGIADAAVPVWDEEANTVTADLKEWTQWPESYAAQFKISGHENTVYPDLIVKSLYLVSDPVRELLKVYVPELLTRIALLRDVERMQQKLYWMIAPPMMNCLGEGTEFQPGGMLRRLVVDRKRTEGRPLIRISGIRESYVLVNLALAESLLRRGFSGMKFHEVTME